MSNAMSYKGYTASMVFDAEDKVIVGRVLDIDDIIAFHGESVTEFEANFHAAIEGYLAAPHELGSAPEKPASGKVMPPEFKQLGADEIMSFLLGDPIR